MNPGVKAEQALLTQAEKDHFKQHGLDALHGELALQDLKLFACAALTGLMAGPGTYTPERFASLSFTVGRAMLAELHKIESAPASREQRENAE